MFDWNVNLCLNSEVYKSWNEDRYVYRRWEDSRALFNSSTDSFNTKGVTDIGVIALHLEWTGKKRGNQIDSTSRRLLSRVSREIPQASRVE